MHLSTKHFLDSILSENIGLSPGIVDLISSAQTHPVNIRTQEVSGAKDALTAIVEACKNIDPDTIDVMKIATLKSIATALQELT